MFYYLEGYVRLTLEPIIGRVDRAFATETVESGSVPDRVKPKPLKLVFTAFLLHVHQLKGQCEACTVYRRQVGMWQLDSNTEFFAVSWPRQVSE